MSTPARILMVQGDTSPSAPTAGQILFYAKTNGVFYSKNSDNIETPLGGGSGTVSSVNASGGTTGMSFTGGPITGSGTLTLTGTLGVANGGTGATTQAGAAAAILPSQTGNAGRFLTTDGTNVSWATVTGTGTVTSVGLTSANSAISVAGSPITTIGSFTITANNFTNTDAGIVPASGGGTANFLRADGTWAAPVGSGTVTSVTVNGTTGRITSSGSPITTSGSITLDLAPSGVTANTYGNATQVPVFTVDTYGRITSVTNTTITAGGSGTVTSVAASGSTDISVGGSPITTSGTLTFALTDTGVTANIYGDATTVPQFTVDAKGRITNVTGVPISAGGSSAPEIVIWHYSSGSGGNFTAVDALYSQTSGVTATVTDGANAIATYTFTGKLNPPKSITTYGQTYATNNFTIKDTTSLPSAIVAGGGSAATPDLLSAFTASNIVTLQTRMSDVGASAGLGQRAWLIVVFGF